MRARLPTKRSTDSYALRLGNHTVHLSIGLYADGRPGEVWLDVNKAGTALRVMTIGYAIAISMLLQHGASLETVVHSFLGLRGEPDGPVYGHDRITEASSLPDLVARILAVDYLRWQGFEKPTDEIMTHYRP